MGMSREERESIFEVQTALVPKEFTEENNDELFGIEPEKAIAIKSGLTTTLAERETLKDAYLDVISLEISPDTVGVFKELRLKLLKNRTSIERWHKGEKAFYLAGGKFVDAIKNKEIAVNKEMEIKLEEGEKFYERQEAEKKVSINNARIERIKPFVEDVTGLDFSAMDDYDFDDYVLGKKTRFENEKAAAEKAEADRIEAEKAELARQKAIEAENAKLKAEAEKASAELAKERAEAKAKQDAIELKAKQEREAQAKLQAAKDAEIAKERAAREKLEAEAKAKADVELARIAAEKKASAELAKAPIKKQLSVWVETFELPHLRTDNATSKEIKEKFEAFKKWSLTQINNL